MARDWTPDKIKACLSWALDVERDRVDINDAPQGYMWDVRVDYDINTDTGRKIAFLVPARS